jgi:hypothetical protein
VDILIDMMQMSKREKASIGSFRPVKVAVLDTGLDLNHPSVNPEKYKDFVGSDGAPRKGNTSHGTISVDLILRMYQDADLYVARIFEDDSPCPEDGVACMTQVSFPDFFV